jgi:hypothetical protein
MKCIAHGTKFLGVLLVLASLASSAGAQQNSGFLTDYSKLAPAADNPDSQIWISKDFDFKPYHKIMLDQVEIFVSPTSEYKGVPPDVFEGMADRFKASIKNALRSGYQIVRKPGPDVLRIRPAITGVNLVKPKFNPVNILPVVLVVRTVSGANQAQNVALSGEIEVLGPGDNVVAGAVSIGVGNTAVRAGQQITWKDVQALTDTWAKNLRRRLDEARGVTPHS